MSGALIPSMHGLRALSTLVGQNRVAFTNKDASVSPRISSRKSSSRIETDVS